MPAANRGSDMLGRLGADGRQETHESASARDTRPTRPEGVTQEVERVLTEVPATSIVFAIDDLRLRRVKLQLALAQPPSHRLQDVLGLGSTHAVDHDIVSISLEQNGRKLPTHPSVECVVHEQVRQQRADHTSLWRSGALIFQDSILALDRGFEPPLDE